MVNILQKMIYNLSAISPILFFFSIVWIIQKKTWTIPIICIILGIVFIVLFVISFLYGLKNLAPIKIRASDISPNDGLIVVYIITYLAPFSSIVINDFNLVFCGLIALLIAVIAPFVNSAIPNPLLFIRKYHFYKVSAENGMSGYVLISKKKYRNKQELKYVNRIFDFLILNVER